MSIIITSGIIKNDTDRIKLALYTAVTMCNYDIEYKNNFPVLKKINERFYYPSWPAYNYYVPDRETIVKYIKSLCYKQKLEYDKKESHHPYEMIYELSPKIELKLVYENFILCEKNIGLIKAIYIESDSFEEEQPTEIISEESENQDDDNHRGISMLFKNRHKNRDKFKNNK